MEKLRGLDKVRVSKEFLLRKLKENKKQHKDLYEEAINSWQKQVVAELEEEIEKVKKNRDHSPSLYFPKPYCHTKEYDKVIGMLEASLDEEFEIDHSDFCRYVQDEWSWKSDFDTTVSGCLSYVGR